MKDVIVQTSALVEELHRHAPGILDELKRRFPQADELLKRGKQLGDDGTKSDQSAALLALASEAVHAARTHSVSLRDHLHKRIRRAMRLRLWAAAASTIASAGVVGLLLAAQNTAAIITAGIALAGSLMSVLAQYFEDISTSKGGSPSAKRDRVAEIASELASLEGELSMARIADPDSAGSGALTMRANGLVAELRRIEFETI